MSIEDNSFTTKSWILKGGDNYTTVEDQVIFRGEVDMHRNVCEQTVFYVHCEAYYYPLEKGNILLERKGDIKLQTQELETILTQSSDHAFQKVEERVYKLGGVLIRGIQSYMPIVFRDSNCSVLNTTIHTSVITLSKASDSQSSGVIIEPEEVKDVPEEGTAQPVLFNSLKLYYFPNCPDNDQVELIDIKRVFQRHVIIIERK